MKWKTHVISGYGLALFISGFTVGVGMEIIKVGDNVLKTSINLMLAAIAVGLILPDIDMFFPPRSSGSLLSHRGITHHFIVPLIIFVVGIIIEIFSKVSYTSAYISAMFIGVASGMAVHIFQDMFSILGVPNPFYFNYKKRWRFKLYKTGHPSEYLIAVVLLAMTYGVYVVFLGPHFMDNNYSLFY